MSLSINLGLEDGQKKKQGVKTVPIEGLKHGLEIIIFRIQVTRSTPRRWQKDHIRLSEKIVKWKYQWPTSQPRTQEVNTTAALDDMSQSSKNTKFTKSTWKSIPTRFTKYKGKIQLKQSVLYQKRTCNTESLVDAIQDGGEKLNLQ
jgi:hypothetical protein